MNIIACIINIRKIWILLNNLKILKEKYYERYGKILSVIDRTVYIIR